jgi:hypothetical protein
MSKLLNTDRAGIVFDNDECVDEEPMPEKEEDEVVGSFKEMVELSLIGEFVGMVSLRGECCSFF